MTHSEIYRGTTPTLQFNFSIVDPAEIVVAVLTISKGHVVPIRKELDTATVDDTSVAWTLTQTETMKVAGDATVMMNWVTAGGTRGVSKKERVKFMPNAVREVLG